MRERVQKLMAHASIGSRRACEEIIRQGRVRVNGAVIELGGKADPAADAIEVDGQRLRFDEAVSSLYIAVNKPRNVLSTNVARDGERRRTVRDLVLHEGHLFTIGRLDAGSDGLVVLTNDGDLTNQLTHPRYRHTKTYRVIVYGMPDGETIKKWERGIHLEDGLTAPCSVRIIKHEKGLTTLKIIMTEGKKRQIRRVAAQLGCPVRHLTRTHIGKLDLAKLNLKPGEWRELTAEEVSVLKTPDRLAAEVPRRRERSRSFGQRQQQHARRDKKR